MILKTERLSLRPLSHADRDQVHRMMSDAEVMAFWDSEPVDDADVIADIVQRQLAEGERGDAVYWTMERLADGVFLGCADISSIDRWHHRGEVGFMLDRAAWGAGYATEAMGAVIAHAAQGLRLKRLSARTHLGNLRSTRLLERLGFRREGVLRGYVERDGRRRDCALFGLLL
jgi:[ribosomal protein S5]-alanine N-acetyltransferase